MDHLSLCRAGTFMACCTCSTRICLTWGYSPSPFSTGVTSYPSEERRFIQESGSCTGQIVLCMVAGYDHERRQHDLFRMKAVGSPEKGVQGRIGFYSSKKNIFMSGIFKTVIQSSINRVCVVFCSMSHQYKCSVRIHVPEFICNYPDESPGYLLLL